METTDTNDTDTPPNVPDMTWIDAHTLVRACAKQLGMSEKFEGASPMAVSLLHHVAMVAYEAGFTEARTRIAIALRDVIPTIANNSNR